MTAPDLELARITRNLRWTQAGLVVCLGMLGMQFFGLGPMPSKLRASKGIDVGPGGELSMRVYDDGARIDYGREGSPTGFSMSCQEGLCLLALRNYDGPIATAELSASSAAGLRVSLHEGQETDYETIASLHATPGSVNITDGNGMVWIEPKLFSLANRDDGRVSLQVDDDPSLVLEGKNSYRSMFSTEPAPPKPQ